MPARFVTLARFVSASCWKVHSLDDLSLFPLSIYFCLSVCLSLSLARSLAHSVDWGWGLLSVLNWNYSVFFGGVDYKAIAACSSMIHDCIDTEWSCGLILCYRCPVPIRERKYALNILGFDIDPLVRYNITVWNSVMKWSFLTVYMILVLTVTVKPANTSPGCKFVKW